MHVFVSHSLLNWKILGCWKTCSTVSSGSSLHSLLGVRLRVSASCSEDPLSFSGVGSSSLLCALPMWIFNPFSDFKFESHWVHLKFRLSDVTWTGTFSVSSWVPFLASLILFSLLSWLGYFFFCQELLTSSLLSKLKLSLPQEKLKLNLWLDCTSPWQKARHFSITESFIFTDQGHIRKVVTCWSIASIAVC